MLKTLSTESAEPRKGIAGVGGGGKSRAEPLGKHDVDGVDDGGGRSGDFDRKFHPRLQYIAAPFTSMLKTSSSTNPSTSETQIAVEYDEVDGGGKSVKKSSKSRQKVEESSKGPKNLNCRREVARTRFDHVLLQGYSRRAHQRTHQLARPRLRSSMMRLMVVESWSKSRQKVVKRSKNHQKVRKTSKA